MAQDRYIHLALVQARQKLDKENRIVARLENSQNSLLERLAPHKRSSASSSYSSDSLSSTSSWSSSGGGRVRKMFAARNKTGVDKSVPLHPVGDNREGRRNGVSLERGRKRTTKKERRTEGCQKRSQSEISHPHHDKTERQKKIKHEARKKPEQQQKPYVFNVPPNSIKAKMPKTKSLKGKTKSAVQKFAPKPGLVQCKNCTRNFASDRIETHRNICKKTQKKRKPFDISKARVDGTDAANYKPTNKGGGKTKSTPKSDWRKKREEFISALRAAKEAQIFVAKGGNIKDLPPPPPMDTSHYVQCPHCHRKFSESVAERHVPKCSNIKSNKKRK